MDAAARGRTVLVVPAVTAFRLLIRGEIAAGALGMTIYVLIIEDSESDAFLMERALRRDGFDLVAQRVATEADLSEALPQVAWAVVLSDYSMPGFNAASALRLVREFAPELPFILVSGTVGEEAAAAAVKAGADDFVLKSNLARLGPAVRTALRGAEAKRAWLRAERELKEREARFRSIIENVSDLVLILDSGSRVRYQSPSVQRTLGYSPSMLGGTDIFEHVHPDDVQFVRAALAGKKQGPDPSRAIQCRMQHSDGGWRLLEGSATDLLKDPSVAGLVCHVRDVTDLRRAEEERLRSQRLESIGSLASGVAHDLNNLLTPILISAEMLGEDLPAEERHVLLDGLRSSASRAAEVVKHLLSFARGVSPGRTLVDTGALFQELERLLRFSLPKGIRRRTVIPNGLWPVCGDATQILQVLMNLCVNARDAMPGGGVLTVEAENVFLREYDLRRDERARPGPYIHVKVTDAGGGIPLAIQKRIFEPFYTTKGRERGTGLGLSTSLEIIRSHGGLLRLYSELGRGTRFSVYIPAETSDSRSVMLPRGNGECLLVVDDEASLREVVRETLNAYGYCVLSAANGAEALAVHARHRGEIRLAIIDIAMPLVDGPATVKALRRVDPDLPVLVQGGFVGEARASFPDDVTDFVEKPYTTETLLNAVADILVRQASPHRARPAVDADAPDRR